MKRFLIISNILAIGLVVAYGAISFVAPPIAAYVWHEEYKELMFSCDQAMREHFIAKQAVEHTPSDETIKNLQATELGLLDCHDYDRLRKRMLAWGLTSHQLASIGLDALEEKKYELRKFVEIHEIRY